MSSSETVKRSAVLSTFPWLTDFFTVGKSAEVVSDLRYAPFFKVLQEFENKLGVITDLDAFDLRRELLIMDTVLAAHMPKNVVSTRSNLCGVISCYKLADVLHFLNHPTAQSQGRQPRYSRMPAIGVKGDEKWPMSDWVETLRLGHRRLQALDTKWMSTTNSVGSPSSLPEVPLRTKLFQDLHTLDQQHNSLKMLFNVQVAAIHLFFILHGHKKYDSTRVPLPDIPNTFELNAPCSKEQSNFFWNLTQKPPSEQRFPLRSALLLSPLVLLIDKNLMKHKLNQNQLLQASKALGNRRPELLLRIEFHMWNALVSIATGHASAYSAIRVFFSSIPWDDVGVLSQADRDFFKPDAVKLDVPISLLGIKAELRPTPCGPSPSASTQVALVADNLGHNHPIKVDNSEDESASFQLKQSSPLTNPPTSRMQSTSTDLTRAQEDTPAKNAQSQPTSPPLPKRNLKKKAPQAHLPPSKKPRLTMESSGVKGNPPPIVGSGSHFEPINLLNWKIWTAAELNIYKIVIVPQTKVEFFGSNYLPDPTESPLVGFMTNESRETATDKKTKQLLQYLDLAMDPKMGQGAVDNFAAELLRGLNYDDNDRIVFIRYPLPFLICGENPIAQADVCLLDDHEILLLLQNGEGSSDPEPQIIAGAIAAFVTNNMRRERRRDLQPRHIVMFPALTMVGTTPTFYKVIVTATLSKAVQTGTCPETETHVFRYIPDLPSRNSEGMHSLLNRIEILRCLEAFKMFVGK